MSSSDYASACEDEEDCEGGGNAVLAYIILGFIGICVCFCGIYFLIKCLRKMEQTEIKNKRKEKAVAEAEMKYADHLGDVKKNAKAPHDDEVATANYPPPQFG